MDCRTDIFSFGAVFYEMLCGQRAFQRETTAETMTAILKEEPAELMESGRQIPPALDRIVRHCLEKAPEQRFQSARDLAFDLESLSTLTGSGSVSTAHGEAAPALGLSGSYRRAGHRRGGAGLEARLPCCNRKRTRSFTSSPIVAEA